MRRTVFVMFTFLALNTPIQLWAQPTLSGSISGSLGPGDFIVTGDCEVPQNEILTLQPGTTLLYAGHYFLSVYGQLIAEGTETDSIVFTRQFPNEQCKHGGIRMQPGSSMDHRLAYCRVEYVDNPDFPECFGGGIFCEGAGISITHCTITQCRALFGAGIYLIETDAVVSECALTLCTAIAEGAALYVAFSDITISQCDVMENEGDHVGGIYIYTCDSAEVGHCTVQSNTAHSTAG